MTYHIWLNGMAYGGELLTAEEPLDHGGVYNQATAQALIWGGEPVVIEGMTNLRSHLDRILRRARAGSLVLDQLEIRAVAR